MSKLFRQIEMDDIGTTEPVEYVAVHPLVWGDKDKPDCGFTELDGEIKHKSDCATHNETAIPKRLCDCKAVLEAFTEASKPLVELLCKNYHPHVTVIVTPTGFELVEGLVSNPKITEFLQD